MIQLTEEEHGQLCRDAEPVRAIRRIAAAAGLNVLFPLRVIPEMKRGNGNDVLITTEVRGVAYAPSINGKAPPPPKMPVLPEACDQCKVPPRGWICTRIKGHQGPCAAWPVLESDEDVQQIAPPEKPIVPMIIVGIAIGLALGASIISFLFHRA